MNKTRNIIQTVPERDIIKTAPDLVVYIEGLPFIVNPFVSSEGNPGVVVNFNDHVTNFSASYNIDSLVPTGTITLQIPTEDKYLYRAPGGVNVFATMMQIQVYAKGYYLSKNGNSIYRRVFKGLISNLNYSDSNTHLTITLQCVGIMHFLERTFIDFNPAAQTNSDVPNLGLATVLANFNPYGAIAWLFLKSLSFTGFLIQNVNQTDIANSPYSQSLQDGYINKWQNILNQVAQEVHIFGLQYKDNISAVGQKTTTIVNTDGDEQKNSLQKFEAYIHSLSAQVDDDVYFKSIQDYLPDASIGGFQLLGGNLGSRADYIRHLVDLIGFEAYQDIDGSIIIKPPLYNLDVTDVGDNQSTDSSSADIYNENNPFIIHMAELHAETETEDQNAIKATRMVVLANFDRHLQILGGEDFKPVADYIDVDKVAQFGIRAEAPQSVGWFTGGDGPACFGYAASELARKNRGWRTYACTIPMRPELKLGFPVYLPHRDMYGYIQSISINYQVGVDATMSLQLDTLRKRRMFKQVPVEGQPNSTDIFTTQKDLVYRWTSGNTAGRPATLPNPVNNTPQQQALMDYYKKRNATYQSSEIDTSSNSWRLQEDKETYTNTKGEVITGGHFSSTSKAVKDVGKQNPARSVDGNYLAELKYVRPYSDGKGYELISPFPWGRWKTLKEAIKEFTQAGYIVADGNKKPTKVLNATRSFLFAGVSIPSGTSSGSASIQDAFQSLQNPVQNYTSFELTYEQSTPPVQQPDNMVNSSNSSTSSNASSRADAFLSPMQPNAISNYTKALNTSLDKGAI